MFKGLEAEMGRPKVYDGENYLSYPVRYIQEEMVVEKTSDIQIFIIIQHRISDVKRNILISDKKIDRENLMKYNVLIKEVWEFHKVC